MFDGLLNNVWVLVLLASVFALVITLTIAAVRYAQSPVRRMKFDEAMKYISSSEFDEIDTALNPTKKKRRTWSEYWYEKTVNTGRVVPDPKAPAKLATTLVLVGVLVGFFVFPGGFLGVVAAPVAILIVYKALLDRDVSKRRKTIDKQIPLLLSGMKANLQAGATPQLAIYQMADDFPSPLGDEIRIVKSDLELNNTLEESLELLAQRVPSKEIKFFVSSVNIATSSGADLIPLLEIIYSNVVQRTRLANKLKTAVAQAKPTAILAYASVPLMMFVSFRNKENVQFWLDGGLGTVMLIGVIVLYVSGYFAINAMVRSVENS